MFKTAVVASLLAGVSADFMLKGKPSAKGPKGKGGKGRKGGKGDSTSSSGNSSSYSVNGTMSEESAFTNSSATDTRGTKGSKGALCSMDTLGSPCGNPYWEYGLDNGYGAWCTVNTESEPVCIASGGCITYECDSSSQCPDGWHCFDNGGWGNECGEACKGNDCYEAMSIADLVDAGSFETWEYSGSGWGSSSSQSENSILFGALFAMAGASVAGFFTYSVMKMKSKKDHFELAQESYNANL